MKCARVVFGILTILVFVGCKKSEVATPVATSPANEIRTENNNEVNKEAEKERRNKKEVYSLEELRAAIENGMIPDIDGLLAVYDVEGALPDLRDFNDLIILNILTKRYVEKLIIGNSLNDMCKYLNINAGPGATEFSGEKYGDIDTLEILPGFSKLENFTIRESGIRTIRIPHRIESIRTFRVLGSSNITDTSFLENLPGLETLILSLSETNTVKFKLYKNLRLKWIYISGNIMSIEGLDTCPEIERFSLEKHPNVESLIDKLPNNIKRLSLVDCKNMRISIVGKMPISVQEVYLEGADILFNIKDIRDYGNIEIQITGSNAINFFKEHGYIPRTTEEESFMVGKTKYTIRETIEP